MADHQRVADRLAAATLAPGWQAGEVLQAQASASSAPPPSGSAGIRDNPDWDAMSADERRDWLLKANARQSGLAGSRY